MTWSPDQKYLYFFGSGLTTSRIKQIRGVYAVALKAGQALPEFPAAGLKSEAEFKKLGAIQLTNPELEELSPGPTPHMFAFSKRTIQRNLYRVPLP